MSSSSLCKHRRTWNQLNKLYKNIHLCNVYAVYNHNHLKHLNLCVPLVLYGFGTWSVTLREEHRPRVFENRVLRKVFGPKREEVAGG
jgi:hypothetical protein